jgi:hypothetical protein
MWIWRQRRPETIERHRDEILRQINDYEAETVALIQIDEEVRNKFEDSITSLAEFTRDWRR